MSGGAGALWWFQICPQIILHLSSKVKPNSPPLEYGLNDTLLPRGRSDAM